MRTSLGPNLSRIEGNGNLKDLTVTFRWLNSTEQASCLRWGALRPGPLRDLKPLPTIHQDLQRSRQTWRTGERM